MDSGRIYRKIAATCLCGNARKAARLLTQLYDTALEPAGLRATQFNTLVALRVVGTVPMTELADAMSMDRTTLTRNLRHLEENGWAVVEPGPDRRTRLARLTPAGDDMLQSGLPRWEAAQSEARRIIGESESDTLTDQLLALVNRCREAGLAPD